MRPRTMTVIALGLGLAAGPLAPRGVAADGPPRRLPVEFRVANVNRSAVPCAADGRAYRVRGELVLPAGPRPGTVTVALHEFSFGRFFWSLPGHPAHDFALAMAQRGHAWLSIDRLGYDGSDHPPGTATCLGAQADIAAQVVRAVASGDYALDGRSYGIAFGRVVLAGHSVGAGVAELAAHSFPTLPLAGLAVFAWADQGYSAGALRQSADQAADCASGGERPEPGAPPGYAWFGRTPAQFQHNMFFDAEPSVATTATALRNRDPCGDNASLARLAVVNRMRLSRIRVPVLLLFGEHDPVFTADAADAQAAAFTASDAVELHRIPRAAHALTLERSGGQARAHTAAWLSRHARPVHR